MSTSPSETKREKLDVETPQDREARLGQLLSGITTQRDDRSKSPASPINPIPSRPFAMPESDALARARAFLPLLQASNVELLARAAEDPDAVDMEKADGDRVIAMDLGLGVFDAPQNPSGDLGPVVDSRPPAELQRGEGDSEDEDESESSSEESSESESESEDEKKEAAS
ncbi:hypothetical protein CI109_101622 [Kwoniella shandongensis]|uniref:Uncharacterized protein n=1 Tax=Kwoniella shandongensis TaxID=1734106 RepID=A0A5M6C6Z6_9TREE|nr:uncharacterized protein CI109_001253 [Kwoniella shandongensis]KAA5530450.1 hypothetical protein CI109_001253 [Kwoniella shandongensis]